jgi:glycosyltransferase involved in cell wall biosynthesis
MEAYLNIMKRLIVSAVNFSEGGPLAILIDGLDAAAISLGLEWEIFALVHKNGLIKNPRIRTIEFPESKNSWLNRIRLEWFGFNVLSKKLKPDLWLSLHDITPRIKAKRQAVYCHNPAPFFRISLKEALLAPNFALFTWFYRYLYRLFIHRNYSVIVQQCWIRDAFRELYRHPSIVVAHPTVSSIAPNSTISPICSSKGKVVFFYPALPRVFKNFEVLCQAVECLPKSVTDRIEVRMTIDGSETPYSWNLRRRYGSIEALKFIGQQNRKAMERQYVECDVVVFPSRLETWGLPISEAKALGKPLLVSDLPYARETTGSYPDVTFVAACDSDAWGDLMRQVVDGTIRYEGNVSSPPDAPFAENWPALWAMLTDGL